MRSCPLGRKIISLILWVITLYVGANSFAKLLFIREFSRIKRNAAPAAPTGTHKPIDAIASSLLRDSAASKTGHPLLRDRSAKQRAGNAPKKGSGHPPAPLWFTALRLGDDHAEADGRQRDHLAIARKGPRRLRLANPPVTLCRLQRPRPDFGTKPAKPLAPAANPSAAHPRWSPTTIGQERPGWVKRTAQSGHFTPHNP